MRGTMLDLLMMEYKRVLSDISEIQKIPERWGAIMLPISAGILALAVNSMKALPSIGVAFLVFLSIATILIWRLIGYTSWYKVRMLSERLRSPEEKISEYKDAVETVLYDHSER